MSLPHKEPLKRASSGIVNYYGQTKAKYNDSLNKFIDGGLLKKRRVDSGSDVPSTSSNPQTPAPLPHPDLGRQEIKVIAKSKEPETSAVNLTIGTEPAIDAAQLRDNWLSSFPCLAGTIMPRGETLSQREIEAIDDSDLMEVTALLRPQAQNGPTTGSESILPLPAGNDGQESEVTDKLNALSMMTENAAWAEGAEQTQRRDPPALAPSVPSPILENISLQSTNQTLRTTIVAQSDVEAPAEASGPPPTTADDQTRAPFFETSQVIVAREVKPLSQALNSVPYAATLKSFFFAQDSTRASPPPQDQTVAGHAAKEGDSSDDEPLAVRRMSTSQPHTESSLHISGTLHIHSRLPLVHHDAVLVGESHGPAGLNSTSISFLLSEEDRAHAHRWMARHHAFKCVLPS